MWLTSANVDDGERKRELAGVAESNWSSVVGRNQAVDDVSFYFLLIKVKLERASFPSLFGDLCTPKCCHGATTSRAVREYYIQSFALFASDNSTTVYPVLMIFK